MSLFGRMNLDDLDAVELAQRLAERHRGDGTHFVFRELATGLKICRDLRLDGYVDGQKEPKLARVHIALEVAESSMWLLQMPIPTLIK